MCYWLPQLVLNTLKTQLSAGLGPPVMSVPLLGRAGFEP